MGPRTREEGTVGVRKVAVEKVSSYARPHEPHAPPYGIRPTCLLETNDIGEFIDGKMGRCPILPPTKVSQLCGVSTYNVIGALRSCVGTRMTNDSERESIDRGSILPSKVSKDWKMYFEIRYLRKKFK